MINKIKNYILNNKKNTALAAVLIAVLIFSCICCVSYNASVSSIYYSSDAMQDITGPIWDGTEIKQTFTAEKDGLNAIGLRFATYSRECSGKISIAIYDLSHEDKKLVHSENFPASTLSDNHFKNISFKPVRNSEGHIFELIVSATDTGDRPATIWCSQDSSLNNGKLEINGVESASILNLKLYNVVGGTMNSAITIVFFLILISFVCICVKFKLFMFADSLNKKVIRILIAVLFAFLFITSIGSYSNGAKIFYKPNYIPIAALIVLTAISIVFEKRIGLYSSVLNYLKAEKNAVADKALNLKGKSATYIIKNLLYILLRILSKLSILVFTVLAIILLALNYISATAVILMLILSLTAIASTLIYETVFEKKASVAALFLLVTLVAGLFITYTFPPTTDYLWDAEIHYARTVDLKNALFLLNEASTFDAEQEAKFTNVANDYIANINTIIPRFTLFFNQRTFDIKSGFNIYNHIGYLPSAIVLALSSILGMSFLPTFTLAKFANTAVYALLLYAAIKKISSGKYAFIAAALIPTAVFLATGFNYDFWVTAFIAYAFAIFISELQNSEKKFEGKDIFLMLAAMFIGCGPKAIYFVLIIPFLFMPKTKFDGTSQRKKYIITCLISFGAILLSFALPFFADIDGATDFRGDSGVNSSEQLKFILTNPLKYVEIFIKFICDYLAISSPNPNHGINQNLTSFCLLGEVGYFYGTIAIILLVFATFADKNDDIYVGRKAICISGFITYIVQIGLIATALYIAFTPVANPTINGVQYRYTFPLLFMFMHIVGSGKIKMQLNKNLINGVLLGALTLNIYASLYDAYYNRIAALI